MTYKILLAMHGLVGLVALVTYWLAAFARKGSPWHRAVGKAYMLAMLGIVATATPMAIIIAAQGKYAIAIFLGYLVIVTATGIWLGWRSIRRKGDQTAFRDRAYLAVALLNLGAAATSATVGAKIGNPLLIGFSAVGLIGGTQMLLRRARPLANARWWLREHFAAMIGCGVATHVAFLQIGFARLAQMFGLHPPAWYSMIGWFLPVAVSVAVGIRLNRKYMSKTRPAMPLPAHA